MSCSVDGCDRKIRAVKLRLCGGHYAQFLRHGTTNGRVRIIGETLDFLNSLIGHTGNECVKWPFSVDGDGGAKITINGVNKTAYREMCEMAHGAPPTPKHHATHTCGKGHEACVNPNHLEWGTASKNQLDRILHGTSNRGGQHGLSKLNSEQVTEIFRRLNAGESPTRIAADYGVSRPTICDIRSGRRWAWLTGVERSAA